MYNAIPKRMSLSAVAGLAMMVLSGCDSGTETGDGEEPQGSPSLSLRVRHAHHTATYYDAVITNDVPKPVHIELNGIPGRFEGTPTSDILFDTLLTDDSPFLVPWERLLQSTTTRPLPFLGGSMLVDSVTPDTTRIMRMGTFADGESGGAVFPDSLLEAYSLYDTSFQAGITAVYFSGPATIHVDRTLCDSTRVKFQLQIPGAGFWLLRTIQSGKEMRLTLLGDTKNLVFGVNTLSEAGADFIGEEFQRLWGCMAGLQKTGTGKGMVDWMMRAD